MSPKYTHIKVDVKQPKAKPHPYDPYRVICHTTKVTGFAKLTHYNTYSSAIRMTTTDSSKAIPTRTIRNSC
jgi:hypothetical protein